MFSLTTEWMPHASSATDSPDLLRERRDRGFRLRAIDRHRAAGESRGIEKAEHEVGVGHRRHACRRGRSTPDPARRPRCAARP